MSGPTFSIVIPTYNRCELVGGAIRSALAQTYTDFELVVSDNHSADETRSVIETFGDERLRYVQPPEHMVMPDHWEFVRSQARGDLVLLLGDDDALVSSTLARFVEAHRATKADFLFSTVAEYLAPGFAGPRPNTLVCLPFTGATAVLEPEAFLGPLFAAFQPAYRMDPSAFVFSRDLADRVAADCGRFFDTQGAEYYAWPLAAVYAARIAHVSAPLLVTGRTAKSWGTNMVLVNPGQERIQTLLSDVITDWQASPVSNFTFANLMAEGMLTAKARSPERLAGYEVNTRAFVMAIDRELRDRESKGVDVRADLAELQAYAAAHPEIGPLGASEAPARPDLTGRAFRKARRIAARVRGSAPDVHQGFKAGGAEYGFGDIVGAAELLGRVIAAPADGLVPLGAGGG